MTGGPALFEAEQDPETADLSRPAHP